MNWLYKCKRIVPELREEWLENRQAKLEYKNAVLVNQLAIMRSLMFLLSRDPSGREMQKQLSTLIKLGKQILKKTNKEDWYEKESGQTDA